MDCEEEGYAEVTNPIEFQSGAGTLVRGFFEGLIGIMMNCLKKSIGQSKMSLDEIAMLVIEVEAILNSRPLYLSVYRR